MLRMSGRVFVKCCHWNRPPDKVKDRLPECFPAGGLVFTKDRLPECFPAGGLVFTDDSRQDD